MSHRAHGSPRPMLPAIRFAAAAVVGAVFALAHSNGVALAHGTSRLTPAQLPSQWTLEAQVIIPIAILAWFYGVGVRALWRHAGRGRGILAWQAVAFAAGVLTLIIALVSPLDAASSAVFSAHMAQHALLMLVAAPLLVLGEPGIAYAWALPRGVLRGVHRVQRNSTWTAIATGATHPIVVWVLFAATFWFWHAPPIYDAGVRHDALHALEHGTLLGVSLLFWWTALRTAGHRRLEYGAAVLFVFTTMLQMMIVPALLVFSGTAWYPYYAHIDPAWRLTPMQDQSLAGLIMWMPSNVLFLVLGGYHVARWLQDDERRASEQVRYIDAARGSAAAAPQREPEEASRAVTR